MRMSITILTIDDIDGILGNIILPIFFPKSMSNIARLLSDSANTTYTYNYSNSSSSYHMYAWLRLQYLHVKFAARYDLSLPSKKPR